MFLNYYLYDHLIDAIVWRIIHFIKQHSTFFAIFFLFFSKILISYFTFLEHIYLFFYFFLFSFARSFTTFSTNFHIINYTFFVCQMFQALKLNVFAMFYAQTKQITKKYSNFALSWFLTWIPELKVIFNKKNNKFFIFKIWIFYIYFFIFKYNFLWLDFVCLIFEPKKRKKCRN